MSLLVRAERVSVIVAIFSSFFSMANLLKTGDKNNLFCPPNSLLMKTTDMGSFGELRCNYLYISDLVGIFEKICFLVISFVFGIYFPMQ